MSRHIEESVLFGGTSLNKSENIPTHYLEFTMPHLRGQEVPVVALSVFLLGVSGTFSGLAWYRDVTMFNGGFAFIWQGFSGVVSRGLLGFCVGALIVGNVLFRTPLRDQSSSNNRHEPASTDCD